MTLNGTVCMKMSVRESFIFRSVAGPFFATEGSRVPTSKEYEKEAIHDKTVKNKRGQEMKKCDESDSPYVGDNNC